MFSNAFAAFLKGEKETSETILENFARSCIDSATALVRASTSARILTSKMAYPDADSKRRCVAMLVVVAARDVRGLAFNNDFS
jgi:hypothetical protein